MYKSGDLLLHLLNDLLLFSKNQIGQQVSLEGTSIALYPFDFLWKPKFGAVEPRDFQNDTHRP